MQYLGSKQRISGWILDQIEAEFGSRSFFVDLMSGSGAVSHEALSRGMRIYANDIQPYSYAVLKSAFQVPKAGIKALIATVESTSFDDEDLLEGREELSEYLAREMYYLNQRQSPDFDWESYQEFCKGPFLTTSGKTNVATFDLFSTYYANSYFGVRQCLEIDALRQLAAQLDQDAASHLIASITSAMTFLSSSTTHLAQFLKPSSDKNARDLLDRRSRSVVHAVLDKLRALEEYEPTPVGDVTNLDFEDALGQLDVPGKSGIVYADPPYFKEHYSRYYHVLDTLVLYDYPELTFNSRLNRTTVGRYRENRIRSKFGLKSQVSGAFGRLFELAAAKSLDVALSYADTSLLPADAIVRLAEAHGYVSKIHETQLRHSGQGQVQTRGTVTEYLFLFKFQGS